MRYLRRFDSLIYMGIPVMLLIFALAYAAPNGPGRGSQGDPCAATEAARAARAADAIPAMQLLRDSVLAATPGGRDAIGLYYRHNARVLQLFARDQSLRAEGARFIVAALPVFRALTDGNGESTTLTSGVVQPSKKFFESLAVADEHYGGGQLASDIRVKLQQLSPETLIGVTVNNALRRLKPAC